MIVLIALYEAIVNSDMKIFLSVAEIANVTKKEKISILCWIKAARLGISARQEYRIAVSEMVAMLK